MRKLTREQTDRLNELMKELSVAEQAVKQAYEHHVACAAVYNDKVEEANGFLRDVEGRIDDYARGQSDAWCESDEGRAYARWLEDWSIAPEPIVVDCPHFVVEASALGCLATEPGEPDAEDGACECPCDYASRCDECSGYWHRVVEEGLYDPIKGWLKV